jgi:hypothetical protein
MGWAARTSDRLADIVALNKRLQQVYGSVLDGRARFRLIHCSELTEKRNGIFSDWYGHILLRTVEETREVYKYQDYRDCFALETLIYAKIPNLVAEGNGHYEPIWIFHDKNDKPVRPTWFTVNLICHSMLHGPKKTVQQLMAEDDERKLKNIAEIKDKLDNRAPYLATRLKERRAVVVPDMSHTKE